MAIFHLDFEGGNDANDGTTFANRWKTLTLGATAARIAAGDTIRIMASPDPVDTGLTATVIGGTVAGVQTYTAASNASPIAITKTAHGLTTGDVIGVYGDTTNTNANGLWRVTVSDADHFSLNSSTGNGAGTSGSFLPMNSALVVLSAAQTLNIAVTPTTGAPVVPNWTPSTNITSTVVTGSSAKTGIANIKLDVGASFTTGKAAYYALPSTLDLSSYQQVSFMCYTSASTTGSWLRICLCSDAAGATPVHQITVPTAKIGSVASFPVTWDNGSALSSTINSIAVYIDTDFGAVSVYVSNFVGCKAPGTASTITHSMLVGRSAAEGFLPIDFINGTDVILKSGGDGGLNARYPNAYQGSSGTFELYKVQPIKLPHTATTSTDYANCSLNPMLSGSAGSPITYSFGWNRTDMSTQTGDTYIDGQQQPCAMLLDNSYVNIVGGSFSRFPFKGFMNRKSNNSIHVNNLSGIGNTAITLSNDTNTGVVENVDVQFNSILSCSAAISLINARKITFSNASVKDIWASHGAGGSININYGRFVTLNNIRLIAPSASTPVSFGASGSLTTNNFSVLRPIGTTAISDGGTNQNVTMNGGTLEPGLTTPYSTINRSSSAIQPDWVLNNVTLSNETSFNLGTIAANTSIIETAICHENVGNVSTDNRIYKAGGTIKSDTTTRHSASGIAWKFSPTNAFRDAANPLDLCLGRFGVSAGTLVTATLWVYRDNAGLSLNFVCRTQEKMGIATESRAACAGTSAWEQLTITFTPSKAGVVELYAEAWGGTTYNGWIDDLGISQA